MDRASGAIRARGGYSVTALWSRLGGNFKLGPITLAVVGYPRGSLGFLCAGGGGVQA